MHGTAQAALVVFLVSVGLGSCTSLGRTDIGGQNSTCEQAAARLLGTDAHTALKVCRHHYMEDRCQAAVAVLRGQPLSRSALPAVCAALETGATAAPPTVAATGLLRRRSASLLGFAVNTDATLSRKDKPSCDHYFGADMTDTSQRITVLDPDVRDGFPDGTKSYVHYSGTGSECVSPAPPRGCHRYIKVYYSPECAALSDGSGHKDWSGAWDDHNLFDRSSGILRSCANDAILIQAICFAAPAEDPQPCACSEVSLGSR